MRFRFLLLLCLISLLFAEVQAQVTKTAVAGNYGLTGVMETAAGFSIKPDGTFEYGFSYGAADKWGRGTWKLSGKQLSLTSQHQQPPQDFKLIRSDKSHKTGIRVKVATAAGQPLPYVKMKLGTETAETNSQGEAVFRQTANGQLEIYHPIFSTRLSQLSLNKAHTNFLITPAADLTEVFFTNFTLEVSPEELISNSLPGMPATDAAGNLKRYVFKREK